MKRIEIITDANDTIRGNCLPRKPIPRQLRKSHKKLSDKTQMQDASRLDLAWPSNLLQRQNQEKEIAKVLSDCINEQRSLKTWSLCV